MKKKKIKVKKFVENEGPVLIDKIYLLTDDEKRGWFRFWTMECTISDKSENFDK